jgi:hypothetical protein
MALAARRCVPPHRYWFHRMFCTIESQCSIFWWVFLSLVGVFRKRESKKIDVAKNSFLDVFEKIIYKPGVRWVLCGTK